MGIRRKKEKMVLTEEKIIDILTYNFLSPNSCKYQMSNLYVFANNWESDFLAITKSGYCYEGEVKISRSDFKADFKKQKKHLILEGKERGIRPNYFFYAVPKDMISTEEVPDYAGLVYIDECDGEMSIVKYPPKIHSEKYTVEQLNLTDKFYYNMVNWKNKAKHDFEDEINTTRQLLKEAKTDENGKKYPFTLGEANEKIKHLESVIESLKKDIGDMKEDISEYRHKIHELIGAKK